MPSSSASVAATASRSPEESCRLDLAALLRRVAGAVGGDAVGQLALPPPRQLVRGEAVDQLDPAAAPHEADRPHARARPARTSRSAASETGERRVIVCCSITGGFHIAISRPARGAPSSSSSSNGEPGEPLGELARVGDRRRGHHEARLGAVDPRHPPQPAQHVRDVRAEDAAVGVGLVHHDPAEVGEEVAPALVVGEDPDVEHVGVGQHQVGAAADRRPLLARRVAVVDRLAQPRRAQLAELAGLVLGQRLGRVEVERARLRLAGDPVEHRQVEGERLAARRCRWSGSGSSGGRSRRPRPGGSRATRSRPSRAPRRARDRATRAAR